ncbi:MAG: hypothetical protein ACRDBO_19255 [Lachnospiraceae bacterium]
MAQHRRNTTSRPRTQRYRKQQQNDWTNLLLFYILPFIVFNAIIFFCVTARPKIILELADTHDYLTAESTLTIKSWFPTKSILISMDNEELEWVKESGRTYKATIIKNGTIEATVTNINGMSTTLFEPVNILDENPPTIDESDIIDGILTITVGDSQSGINFDSLRAEDSSGQPVEPINVDRNNATVSYVMDSAGISVYVQDKAGNQVRGNFTSRTEGDVEILEGDSEVTIE